MRKQLAYIEFKKGDNPNILLNFEGEYYLVNLNDVMTKYHKEFSITEKKASELIIKHQFITIKDALQEFLSKMVAEWVSNYIKKLDPGKLEEVCEVCLYSEEYDMSEYYLNALYCGKGGVDVKRKDRCIIDAFKLDPNKSKEVKK